MLWAGPGSKGRVNLRLLQWSRELLARIKEVPGRRYDPDTRTWSIPQEQFREFRAQLAREGVLLQLDPRLEQALEASERARLRSMELKQLDDSPLELPTPTTPRPYQRAGVRFLEHTLRSFGGALLADDMGLGKTFQALSAAVLLDCQRVLVLCPSSLKYTWAQEVERHYPQLTYVVVDGDRESRKQAWAQEVNVTIANYDLLLRDEEPYLVSWDMVVADEVVWLKNWRAKRTRLARNLERRYTLGLSGVPVENDLLELHSIFDFLIPGVLGPGWLFVSQHCVRNRYGAIVGYRGLEKVKGRIAPYYLRRTKGEVLKELPPRIRTTAPVELSREEWALYEAIVLQIRQAVEANPNLKASNILAQMTKLKEVTSDPRLLGEELASSKLQALQEILASSRGHKVVVFTQFSRLAHTLGRELDCPVISGEVSPQDRDRAIRVFQDGANVLVSTEAGAYGVNLTAADIVVHIDLPWTPARLRQREDRLHRLGQQNVVHSVVLTARRTIDDYVLKVLHRKLELVRRVFEGEEEEIDNRITREELLEVLYAGATYTSTSVSA